MNSPVLGLANRGQRPSDGLARTIYPAIRGQPVQWKNPLGLGPLWSLLGWQALTWDARAWDNLNWDNLMWDDLMWDTLSWDNLMWDNLMWDGVAWDSSGASCGQPAGD